MHKNNNNVSYRRDIDGLRAVAVSAVIAYHAFPAYVSGGYVGVDIFFVISGFLITSIILKASQSGKFSILDFYARRIRRIFPALIAVLVACLATGWFILFPDEMRQLGGHTLAATVFVTNFIFWSEAGYFDTASELKPLLHLWSLSIEEQFYTLWPITLLFFIRCKKPMLLILALAVSSFLLCVFGGLDRVANFYMPLTRVWELLLGGLLAAGQLYYGKKFLVFSESSRVNRAVAECLSIIGVMLLCVAIFSLTAKTVFPGWAALLPTIGAVLLIAAGSSTLINRYLLGNSLFVFIGLISYPLYLWHWPFLSFPKIVSGLDLSISVRILAVLGALVFAILTWLLIERPLRHRGNTTSIVLFIAAVLTGFAGYCFQYDYITKKYSNNLFNKISDAKQDVLYSSLVDGHYNFSLDGADYIGIGTGKNTTLFLGDSNMDQYVLGIQRAVMAKHGVRKALLGGCGFPIRNAIRDDDYRDCISINKKAYEMAIKDPDIDTVVLGAQWRGFQGYHFIDGGQNISMRGTEGKKLALDQLASDISELRAHGKKVYLLLNIPGGPEFDPHNLIHRSLKGFAGAEPHLEGGITLDAHKEITSFISPLLIEAVERNGGVVLDPANFLCVDNWCNAVTPEGEPIYRDMDHLRKSYSYYHPEFISQTLDTSSENP